LNPLTRSLVLVACTGFTATALFAYAALASRNPSVWIFGGLCAIILILAGAATLPRIGGTKSKSSGQQEGSPTSPGGSPATNVTRMRLPLAVFFVMVLLLVALALLALALRNVWLLVPCPAFGGVGALALAARLGR